MKSLKVAVLILLLPGAAYPQSHRIDWHTIELGGGSSASAIYRIAGIVDQPEVGKSESGHFTIESEFGVGITSTDDSNCIYVIGDCNHNGRPLELADVIAMINMYRGRMFPPYVCQCGNQPSIRSFAITADPNGNCVAFELDDVVAEIEAYRGTQEASSCRNCPGLLRLMPGDTGRAVVIPKLKLRTKTGETGASK